MARKPSQLRELMEAARKGSQEAADEIVDQYSGTLLTVIRRKLHPRPQSVLDPEDVLQSAWRHFFVVALQKAAVSDNPTQLVHLLLGLVENKALEANRHWLDIQKRSLKREAHLAHPAGMEKLARTAPEGPAAEETRLEEELEDLLKSHPEETREIVRRYRQGLSVARIARHLGLSESTVRRRVQALLDGAEIPDCLGGPEPPT
jgi:RNA polymerase sigma-70 factor (ECF subfamily)